MEEEGGKGGTCACACGNRMKVTKAARGGSVGQGRAEGGSDGVWASSGGALALGLRDRKFVP